MQHSRFCPVGARLASNTIVFKQSISGDTPQWVEKLHMSNLWLGPLQGIVASALGVVFLSKKDKPAPQGGAGGGD